MAEVPELNILPMDSYSEEGFYADFSCEMNETNIKVDKNCLGWEFCSSDWSSRRSDPLREIRKPKKSSLAFKKAIMIVVVVEKFKGGKGFESQCLFDDFDLLNDILVEEEISICDVERTSATTPKFRYSRSQVCMVADKSGKWLSMQEYEGNARLLALYLQNGNIDNKAKINMGFHTSAPFDGAKDPVTLGIKGRDLYLTCVAEEQSTVLSLTHVTNMQNRKDNDLLPYLFYKRKSGANHTFESVAFPGWYISTSQSDDQFVQMKPTEDQQHIREFMFQQNA